MTRGKKRRTRKSETEVSRAKRLRITYELVAEDVAIILHWETRNGRDTSEMDTQAGVQRVVRAHITNCGIQWVTCTREDRSYWRSYGYKSQEHFRAMARHTFPELRKGER